MKLLITLLTLTIAGCAVPYDSQPEPNWKLAVYDNYRDAP